MSALRVRRKFGRRLSVVSFRDCAQVPTRFLSSLFDVIRPRRVRVKFDDPICPVASNLMHRKFTHTRIIISDTRILTDGFQRLGVSAFDGKDSIVETFEL